MAASCSTPINVEGTNTNWLHCKTDADCTFVETGATCVAGYCNGADGGKLFAQSSSFLKECTWPASLNGDGGPTDYCRGHRSFINCTQPNGLTEACADQTAIDCPGSGAEPCTSVCRSDEYVINCGIPNIPEPPPGCRSVSAFPYGNVFYCCPCGS
jgi:hypothetical protein